MSKGIGRTQRRVLLSIAAITAGQAQGASVFDVLTLWSRLEGTPRQAFDRANLHRGLHALAHRGLLSCTDRADDTPRCVCGHEPADHRDGVGGCRGRTRRCRCRRYAPRPTPRPQWYVTLTPTGHQLIRGDEKAPWVVRWRACQQERLDAFARLQAVCK